MYIPCLPSLVLLVLAADFFERDFVLLLYLLGCDTVFICFGNIDAGEAIVLVDYIPMQGRQLLPFHSSKNCCLFETGRLSPDVRPEAHVWTPALQFAALALAICARKKNSTPSLAPRFHVPMWGLCHQTGHRSHPLRFSRALQFVTYASPDLFLKHPDATPTICLKTNETLQTYF